MAALLLFMPAPAQADPPRAYAQSAGSSLKGHSPPGWSAGTVAHGSGFSRLGGSTRVREVQRKLNRLDYASGEVDGLFGPITDVAVRRFQRGSGLLADGIVGQHTLSKLRSRSRRLERLLARGVGYSKPGGSSRVRALQRKLNRLSYAAGDVDGLFGPITDGAVRRFQSRHGLKVDGIVGPATMERLHLKTQSQPEIQSRAPISPGAPDRVPSGQRGIENPAPNPPRAPDRVPDQRGPAERSPAMPWAPWQGQPLLAQWATILLWTLNSLLLLTALALVISRISSASSRVGRPAARRPEAPEGPGLDRPVLVAQDAYRASVREGASPPPIERLGARLSLSRRQPTAESVGTVDVDLRLFAESADRHWETAVADPTLAAVTVAAEDMHERVRTLVVPERLPTVAAALNDQGVDVRSHYLEEVSFVVELTREVERELLQRGWG